MSGGPVLAGAGLAAVDPRRRPPRLPDDDPARRARVRARPRGDGGAADRGRPRVRRARPLRPRQRRQQRGRAGRRAARDRRRWAPSCRRVRGTARPRPSHTIRSARQARTALARGPHAAARDHRLRGAGGRAGRASTRRSSTPRCTRSGSGSGSPACSSMLGGVVSLVGIENPRARARRPAAAPTGRRG